MNEEVKYVRNNPEAGHFSVGVKLGKWEICGPIVWGQYFGRFEDRYKDPSQYDRDARTIEEERNMYDYLMKRALFVIENTDDRLMIVISLRDLAKYPWFEINEEYCVDDSVVVIHNECGITVIY
jgi:hypothetical protein